MKLSYGKIKKEDGTYEEDKTFPVRVFDGGILKSCFACKHWEHCKAQRLDESKYQNKKDIATVSNSVEDKEEE